MTTVYILAAIYNINQYTDSYTDPHPNAERSKKLGLDVDLSARAFGIRIAQYAMILEDLVVKYVEVSGVFFCFNILFRQSSPGIGGTCTWSYCNWCGGCPG